MSIQNNGKRQIAPCHPGEMIREDFLPEYGLSPEVLAETLKVSPRALGEILCERRPITPLMALRLSRFFGNSPDFWMNAQQRFDLWKAGDAHKDDLERIERISRVLESVPGVKLVRNPGQGAEAA